MSGVGLVVTRQPWGLLAFDGVASLRTHTWALISDMGKQMGDQELRDGIRLVKPDFVFFLGWGTPAPALSRCVVVESAWVNSDTELVFAKAVEQMMAALMLSVIIGGE